jgi:hypothetical protein
MPPSLLLLQRRQLLVALLHRALDVQGLVAQLGIVRLQLQGMRGDRTTGRSSAGRSLPVCVVPTLLLPATSIAANPL